MIQRETFVIPAKCLHTGIEHRISTAEGLQASANDVILLQNGHFIAVLGKERTGNEAAHSAADDTSRMLLGFTHLPE